MLIRSATSEDTNAIYEVFVRARERMAYLPDLRTDQETRGFIRDLTAKSEVWVVEQEQRVLGFSAVRDNVLEHLYVHPIAQSFGIGSALLERVKQRCPEKLECWVFQKNSGARRFYETRGFQLVELTDGSNNEEQEPDALYRWSGSRGA
jgi:GNAT superfamily N-acetyltransferase